MAIADRIKRKPKAIAVPTDFGALGHPIDRTHPFYFGFVATLGALIALVLMRALASTSQIFVLIIVALFRTGNPLIYIAYLFTPFAPIGGLALARATDIKGRTNIKFDIAKSDKVVKTCGIIAIVGFIVAIAVMYEIAKRHSQV